MRKINWVFKPSLGDLILLRWKEMKIEFIFKEYSLKKQAKELCEKFQEIHLANCQVSKKIIIDHLSVFIHFKETQSHFLHHKAIGQTNCQLSSHHCVLLLIQFVITVGMHCVAVVPRQLHSFVKWKVSELE